MTDEEEAYSVMPEEFEIKKGNVIENDRVVLREEIPESLDLNKIIDEFKAAKEYKFIYLVYAVSRHSKYFTPYTFRMVSFANIDKDCFFTLSNEGFMSHFETDVTFTPFANFEEDFRLYQKIVKVSRDRYQLCTYTI